jgi:hypothetical protein
MNEALQALEIKVENGGATPQGKFFAKDWNTLVEAVKQLDLAEFDEAALNKYLKDNGYITSDDIPSTDLSDVVTRSGEQTIPGAKDFTGGLMVNGQPIVWNAEKGVWQLTGDLVVTGAISMFSSLSGFVPSTVTDAVLVDNETIIKVKDAQGNWVLRALGGGSGGTGGGLTAAEVNVLISNALKPYALSSSIPTDNKQLTNGAGYITASALAGLATEQYVTTRGYITSDALAGYATETWVTNKGYITSSALDGYATEQWVGDNYLASSNFTKANIKSTLGISDWALAATKPSYTAAEVGALSTSGGSVSSDDYQPLFVNSNFSSGIEDVRIAIAHNWNVKGLFNWESNGVGLRMYNTTCGSAIGIKDDGTPYFDSYELIHLGNIGSCNAGSATKLQTPRTIWGQSFDGTGNVYGSFYTTDNIFLNSGGEGIYISANSINWHNSSNGWSNGLLGFIADGTVVAHNKLAIGGTTADAKLHVYGDTIVDGSLETSKIYIEDASTPLTRFVIAGSLRATVGYETNFGAILQSYVGGHYFLLKDDTTAYISCNTTINGNLLTTGSITANKIYAASSTATSLIEIKVNSDTSVATFGYENGYGAIIQSYKGGNYFLLKDDNTAYISCNTIVGGAITMFSQASLKNIVDERGLSLDELATIKPTRFYWKDGRDDKLHVGGIADDVIKVLPEAIYHTSDGTMTMDYGSAAFFIGASLIKPVLDHERRISDLERENKQLKQQLERLSAA